MSKSTPSTPGERIKALRVARNLTQEQLAEMSGLSRDALSRIERGDRSARITTLSQLSGALSVPISSLVSGTSDPAPARRAAWDDVRAVLSRLEERDAKLVAKLVRVLAAELSSRNKRALRDK